MLLFQFNKKDKCVLHPEALKLTRHIKKLSDEQFLYVVLAYDYKSKFRLYPASDRRRLALREVWGESSTIPENDVKVEKAIEEYNILQFDFKRDLCDKYMEKIRLLQDQLILENDPAKINKIDGAIKTLEIRTVDIQREIDKDESTEELRAGAEASFIELWQQRMRDEKKKAKNKPQVPSFDDQRHGVMSFEDDEFED